jgi:phenylpropionate dioxygenase-like ring-hydroxylating dioxygenase large terminal subunit
MFNVLNLLLLSRLSSSNGFRVQSCGCLSRFHGDHRRGDHSFHAQYSKLSSSDTAIIDLNQNDELAVPFEWSKHWYPVVLIQDLDRDGPNKITLLGLDMAVWFHKPTSSWRAFKDSCPHRLVPLSEGRVENTGVLQCAYHGWEFDNDGKCLKIPQLGVAGGVENPLVQNPRACATSYPAQVQQGLLWIFPTPDEHLAKDPNTPALISELDDPNNVDATAFFFRDMPYSWEILVENLCDPSHIPFAHHGMMRSADRDNVERIDMEVVEESSSGFKARKSPYPIGNGKYDVTFEAPCLLYYQIVDPAGRSFLGLGRMLSLLLLI